jgi:phospholipid/cholesterol/gamma-HCH transport system ATP-binding protein
MVTIECRDVWKSFSRKSVLRGVNLVIHPGETVVIIGQSGSGKSVLLKHIVGLIYPDKGAILVDGVDVTKLQPQETLRASDGLWYGVPGRGAVRSYTVEENVGLMAGEHGPSDAEVRIAGEKNSYRVGSTRWATSTSRNLGRNEEASASRAIAMDPKCVLTTNRRPDWIPSTRTSSIISS